MIHSITRLISCCLRFESLTSSQQRVKGRNLCVCIGMFTQPWMLRSRSNNSDLTQRGTVYALCQCVDTEMRASRFLCYTFLVST